MRTPFALRFMQQTHTEDPHIHNMHIVQHIKAHVYCEQQGGPEKLERAEFYDLFIRPLEFMCGQGMPLHTLLMESVNNYASRCNLLKLLLEIAGFSIFDGMKIQPHAAYAEITRIRHIPGKCLTTSTIRDFPPIQRMDAMPRITYIKHTRPVGGAVEPTDFAPGGRFQHITPHALIPLPDLVLDQFKKLGGRHMPFCDEFALHTNVLRQYQIYQSFPKTIPAQRKPEIRITPPSPDSSTTKSGQRPTVTSSTKTSTARVQIQEDQDSNHSWVEMVEHEDTAQASKQVQKPVPMIMSPQPENNRSPQPRATAATSIPAKDMDNQPIVQLTMAQFQALVNSSPSPQSQAPSKTQQSSPDFFSQTQTQLENTFFDQEAPIIAKQAAAEKDAKQASASKGPFPQPAYHPSIHPRPTWEQLYTAQEQDKIFDSNMIWSCTDHYCIPSWAKSAHSAASLYDLVRKDVPKSESTKARYREMPKYRQFPADGLNHINDVAVYFHSTTREENIHFKVTSQKYKQLSKKTQYVGAPEVAEFHFPSHTLSRFMIFFLEVAKERLKPAMTDVQQEGHELICKISDIANYRITFQIVIASGTNGLERMLEMIYSENHERWEPQTVRIPWIRMAETLIALRQLHEALIQTSYI